MLNSFLIQSLPLLLVFAVLWLASYLQHKKAMQSIKESLEQEKCHVAHLRAGNKTQEPSCSKASIKD